MTTGISEPWTWLPERATPRTGPAGILRRLRAVNPLAALGGLIWLAIVAVPLYWVVLTSLRSQNGFFTASQLIPPSSPTLSNYRLVLSNQFGTYLRNSATVAVGAVLIILVVTAMASYGIVRVGNRGFTGAAFRLFLLGLAIPLQATIIPVYYVITRLHLYNTLLAVILPSAAFAIPVSVLILVNFLRDVPAELFESMRVDGAGEWRMLWQLAVPLARPALVTVAIYDALQVWNGFLFPLILTQSPSLQVLPLALFNYQGQYTINVPAILAAVVLSLLPILALYIVGRRQLVSGLTAGVGK
jgi:raffinose/stachyose/melibiose transport system permease protein